VKLWFKNDTGGVGERKKGGMMPHLCPEPILQVGEILEEWLTVWLNL
jgi:hypothetical protein